MALGSRPVRQGEVVAIFDRKMADFHHTGRSITLQHLDPDAYYDAASQDPDVRMAVETGFYAKLEDDLKDPVLVRLDAHELFTCPPLVLRVLAEEPAEIHRAFIEGAFLRKLFRFFVPATYEGGERWEVNEQVRDVMQRHFAFQLVACESVLGSAAA